MIISAPLSTHNRSKTSLSMTSVLRSIQLKACCAAQPKGCSACFVPVIRKTQNNRNFTLSRYNYIPDPPYTQKKDQKNFLVFLLSSGSGIRTARPSGYEPDELPTALSRDIGLQIYGHFLILQIFIAKIAEFHQDHLSGRTSALR